MYLGQMVETAESNELFSTPLPAYTHALIAASRAVPALGKSGRARSGK